MDDRDLKCGGCAYLGQPGKYGRRCVNPEPVAIQVRGLVRGEQTPACVFRVEETDA